MAVEVGYVPRDWLLLEQVCGLLGSIETPFAEDADELEKKKKKKG